MNVCYPEIKGMHTQPVKYHMYNTHALTSIQQHKYVK